jgi:uncharacterized membrane protein YhaH (DUF805 family)
MPWWQLFFGFEGRINRAKFWLATLVYVFLDTTVKAAISAFGGLGRFHAGFSHPVLIQTLYIGLELGFGLSFLAIGAKRLHDRDKSGWWLLLFCVVALAVMGVGNVLAKELHSPGSAVALLILTDVSFVGWFAIELGCLPGTRGINRYGRNPLATLLD